MVCVSVGAAFADFGFLWFVRYPTGFAGSRGAVRFAERAFRAKPYVANFFALLRCSAWFPFNGRRPDFMRSASPSLTAVLACVLAPLVSGVAAVS